jgi:hypothetical protein
VTSDPDEYLLTPEQIRVRAPKGFKGRYSETAADPASPAVLSDLLGLVGYDVASSVVESWCLLWRVEAEVWAVVEHARASDNPIRRHPRPNWLPEPWKGVSSDGWTANGGTCIEKG